MSKLILIVWMIVMLSACNTLPMIAHHSVDEFSTSNSDKSLTYMSEQPKHALMKTISLSHSSSSINQANDINLNATDKEKPVIKLPGGTYIQHLAGTLFIIPTVTITDNVDRELVALVSGEVQIFPGRYTLTYSVKDTAGNLAILDLIVDVINPG